jgi:hypothetical protein
VLFAMPMKSFAMLQSPAKARWRWVCGVLSLYHYRCMRSCCLKHFSAASVGPFVLSKIHSCPSNLHCKEHAAAPPTRICTMPPGAGQPLTIPPNTPSTPATRDKKKPEHRRASRPSTTSLTTLALTVLNSPCAKASSVLV